MNKIITLLFLIIISTADFASEIRTETHYFRYKMISSETDQMLDITDTVVRVWTDSNQFNEYGHFELGLDSFNTFKKVGNNWYFRDCDQWKLFYSDKLKANHSIYTVAYGLVKTRMSPDTVYPPTPVKCRIKIKWGKSFRCKGRKYRVFAYTISCKRSVFKSNNNYIFDSQNGIVGIILNGGKDTCWRQTL